MYEYIFITIQIPLHHSLSICEYDNVFLMIFFNSSE